MRDTAFLQQAERFAKTDTQRVQDHFLDGLSSMISGPPQALAVTTTHTPVSVVGVGTAEESADMNEAEVGAPSFPVEALPEPVQDFVREAAASLPVPVDLIAAPVLVCLGAAIGTRRAIQLKPDWTAGASLYLACIADPGSLKTPALNLVASPIYRQQDRYKDAYSLALADYDERIARYHRDLDAHKKRETDEVPAKPEKPVFQRTWTADVTTEALGGMLGENPQGILILRDELSAWIKGFNQYRNGNGSDKQFFLSAWSSEPLAVDRKGKDPILVSKPFLSVLGCVPPDVLPDLDEDNREDGFLHRLLFAFPNPVPVRWPSAILRSTVKDAYAELVARLYSLPAHPDGSSIVLPLSPTAKALFIEWHDQHCREQENHALPAIVRGAYAKLKGYAPRFALIHAVASNPRRPRLRRNPSGRPWNSSNISRLKRNVSRRCWPVMPEPRPVAANRVSDAPSPRDDA